METKAQIPGVGSLHLPCGPQGYDLGSRNESRYLYPLSHFTGSTYCKYLILVMRPGPRLGVVIDLRRVRRDSPTALESGEERGLLPQCSSTPPCSVPSEELKNKTKNKPTQSSGLSFTQPVPHVPESPPWVPSWSFERVFLGKVILAKGLRRGKA